LAVTLRAACAIDCLPSCSMDRLHPQDKEVKKTLDCYPR
jgi:hypothetical protein